MAVTRERRRTRSSSTAVSDAESNASSSSHSSAKSKRRRTSKDDKEDTSCTVLHRDTCLAEITNTMKCRPPFLFVNGPPGSGKSCCVSSVMGELAGSLTIAAVDMRDILKVQGFYYAVLSQLIPSPSTIPDHTSDFVRQLIENVTGPCTLLLKHAQLLSTLSPLLFCSVTKLYQLTQQKVNVVMISDASWDLIHPNTGSTLVSPLIIYIPPYNRSQTIDIITHYLYTYTKRRPLCTELDVGEVVIKNYVTTCIYDSLSHYTNSIREMISTSMDMLEKYLEPVRTGLKKTDTVKLYQLLQPCLVSTMAQLGCLPTFKTNLELPYNSRVLLICAFLASHNPARLDKRFFCKGKSSRRKVKSRTTAKLSEVLKGPKTFPLDRLLAIYSSVVQDGTVPCSDIMIAISSLVTLNLIVRVSVDLLEQPKYKCLASLHVIKSLAKESGIQFEQFYYNY